MTNENTVSLIGGHFSRNGVEVNWPSRVVLSCNNNGLGEQHSDTIVIFRDITAPERPSDLYSNPLAKDIAFAYYWYDQYKDEYASTPADYKQFTNEAVGNDPRELDIFVAYERNFCELGSQDGHKFAIGQFGGNAPDFDLWKEYYAPWIKEAWETYGAIYGRHVYGNGDLADADGTMNTQQPAYPKRIIDEIEYLKSIGWNGGIVFTETGLDWGYNQANYPRFYDNITGLEKALRPYADNVIGFCWWECGQTGWNANYTDYLKQLTPYMQANALPKWTAPEQEPIEKPKIVIIKKPQKSEMTLEENQEINTYAWDNYGRTTTHSHDDMLTMLSIGNDESYAVVYYADRPSQQFAIQLLEENGYSYITIPELPQAFTNPPVITE